MRFLILILILGGAAFAEPPKQAELFATVGVSRLAGDEGSEGTGATFGGAATIPLASRWAIDVQALTTTANRFANYDVRYTFLSPGIQYRRGSANAYWFIAGGPGVSVERTTGPLFNRTDSNFMLHWRTGAVYNPTGRLLVRGEFFWVSTYVMPTVGAAVSIGFRPGR